jgi:hypothetical protein
MLTGVALQRVLPLGMLGGVFGQVRYLDLPDLVRAGAEFMPFACQVLEKPPNYPGRSVEHFGRRVSFTLKKRL